MRVREMKQVVLKHGTTEMTCWVDKEVKPGDRITLKNCDPPDVLWDVAWVGESDNEPPSRGWKVGGL
jgi:hypothetical protein